jgi:hypothetical protein
VFPVVVVFPVSNPVVVVTLPVVPFPPVLVSCVVEASVVEVGKLSVVEEEVEEGKKVVSVVVGISSELELSELELSELELSELLSELELELSELLSELELSELEELSPVVLAPVIVLVRSDVVELVLFEVVVEIGKPPVVSCASTSANNNIVMKNPSKIHVIFIVLLPCLIFVCCSSLFLGRLRANFLEYFCFRELSKNMTWFCDVLSRTHIRTVVI